MKQYIEKINFNDIDDSQSKLELVNQWVKLTNSASFYQSKETELQGKFLFDVFGKILGYSSKLENPDEWNLNQEQVTTIGGKFADGSLGFYNIQNKVIRVVIELKNPNTNLDERQHRYQDNRTPVQQAFDYQHSIGRDCKWVIVSNFNEIRLYHHSSSIEFELFYIKDLYDNEKLKYFFFLLGKDNLISKDGNSAIDDLFISNEQEEQEITKTFYAAFKRHRLNFFDQLKKNNPTINENILLEKTQKILDRFIFICFAEDNRLLPELIFKNILKTAKSSFATDETKVWNELKGLFVAINHGSPSHNINKFNGGLFATDEVLDNLRITDQSIEELGAITEYDFESEVSIDILGHIFEQSISDLEEIKANINGEVFEKSKSKRKRDGIVYTPAYITRDIVEKAVGGWLEDRNIELGYYDLLELTDEDYKSIINNRGKLTYNDKIKQHLEFWYAYRERLMNIKVVDPACGSGAFLIQVFDFLYNEGMKVNDTIAKLLGGQYEVFQLDKHILSNNIYGVDINLESVEITKLSLWLKTANKSAELTSLDNNIKCGNSLIDYPEVAGDKAFDWSKEFAEILHDKVINEGLKAYHVTWATFNSRPVGFTNYGSPIILNDETRNQIAEYLDEKIGIEHYRVIAINVLKDHVHCIVVCKEEDLSKIVGQLKGFTSYKFHATTDLVNHRVNPMVDQPQYSDGTRKKLWAKGYSHTYLNDESHYLNTIHYISNNHLKHEQSQLEYKFQNLTPLDEAFAPVVLRGGFDVVVGNPPYGAELTSIEQKYLNQIYDISSTDTAILFIKKSLQILNQSGKLSFIIPKSFTFSSNYKKIREYVWDKIYTIIDCRKVWKEVLLEQVIIRIGNNSCDYYMAGILKNKEIMEIGKIDKNIAKKFDFFLNGVNDNEVGIASKIVDNSITLNDISTNKRGGILQKFIDTDYSSLDNDEIQVIGGAEIDKFGIRGIKGKIKKREIQNQNAYIHHNSILVQRIIAHIENPVDHIMIIACIPNVSSIIIVDTINQITINENFSNKFIWCILKSNLINWYSYRFILGKAIRTMQFDNPITSRIPIPKILVDNENAQQPFITLADTMLDKNKELHEMNSRFQELLKADFNIEKLNTKFESWYNLSWTDFVNELKKLKITLSGEMKEDWIERYNRYKSKVNELQNIIQTIDKKIDQLVYELYGLTEEEIKVVEGE
ncbi:MAG TPA: N-6 DNA methylase [Candidatus Kapabacteria bacterium]|nr:N-6 DNA methylase [Candidatus Kapabacteria bacterium]